MGPCVGNTGPVPRLGFPSLCLQDGPLGVRFADKITSWPAGITTGGTWDKKLFLARGVGMGAEFRGKGAHIMLGPAMGPLGRMPAGGRNWEGFGSDPYLQGIAAGESILGIQSQGVVATAKHYIGMAPACTSHSQTSVTNVRKNSQRAGAFPPGTWRDFLKHR